MISFCKAHDRLQTTRGHFQRPDARDRDERSQLTLLFDDTQEGPRITDGFAADAGDHFPVTAVFPFAACLSIRPPDQGMEPPDQLRDELKLAGDDIASLDVDELMSQNQFDPLERVAS